MAVLRPAFDPKLTASLLACLLGSMLVLAGVSNPPHVEISSLNAIEEGTTVYVSGLLVSLWRYEPGTESLPLADPSAGATLTGKTVCHHWLLFEGDRFNVTGAISTDDGLRLQDLESEYSISLRLAVGAVAPSPGRDVRAGCTLCLHGAQMV